MAVTNKPIKGSGACQLRSQITTTDGTTETEVETWNGPYKELRLKQKSVQRGVQGTNLSPSSGGQGILTITRERETGESSTVPSTVAVEVLWQELRRPVEAHPLFKDLTEKEVLRVKKAVADATDLPAESTSLEYKLYQKLCRATHYSMGVPLIRRTTTKKSGSLAAGATWVRSVPPVEVPGGWQYLKTADERRKDGKSYSQVEEWTGAEEWDADLYPEDPPA